MSATFTKKFFLTVLTICTLMTIKASVALADNNCLSIPNTYDDTSGSLTYSGGTGSWTHGTGWPKACNSTLSWSNSSNASVSFSFNGNSITRVYTMASNRGSETVYIDNVSKGTASSYAPTTRWQTAKTWQAVPGNHTIQVNVAGGGGGFSDLDAFVVNIPFVMAGTYDDAETKRFQYVGTWTHGTGWPLAYGGTDSWSNTTEDAMTFTFMGDQISYIYTKHANRGIAAITIDGVAHALLTTK